MRHAAGKWNSRRRHRRIPPPPRLTVDLATNVITLDNVKYKTDPRGAAVVKAMYSMRRPMGNCRQQSVIIRKRIHDCHHDTTFHRLRKDAPSPIQFCNVSKARAAAAGTYLDYRLPFSGLPIYVWKCVEVVGCLPQPPSRYFPSFAYGCVC